MKKLLMPDIFFFVEESPAEVREKMERLCLNPGEDRFWDYHPTPEGFWIKYQLDWVNGDSRQLHVELRPESDRTLLKVSLGYPSLWWGLIVLVRGLFVMTVYLTLTRNLGEEAMWFGFCLPLVMVMLSLLVFREGRFRILKALKGHLVRRRVVRKRHLFES